MGTPLKNTVARGSQIRLRKSRDLPHFKTWLLMMDEHSNVGSIPIQVIVENSIPFLRVEVAVQVCSSVFVRGGVKQQKFIN